MALRPRLQALTITGWIAACGVAGADPLQLPDSALEPVHWSELEGWGDDDHLAAFATYQASCQVVRRTPRTQDHGPIYRALWELCRQASGEPPRDAAAARTFFEQNFTPVRIARLGEVEGFLTGYYEPIVQGSRFPNPEFHIPLYRRPPDLLVAGRMPGKHEIPNKNASIGRHDEANRLVPYYDRGAGNAQLRERLRAGPCRSRGRGRALCPAAAGPPRRLSALDLGRDHACSTRRRKVRSSARMNWPSSADLKFAAPAGSDASRVR